MKLYVASSWRNPHQPVVVKELRDLGHEIYDFRQPTPDDNGFHWSEIDRAWEKWTVEQYRKALSNSIAERGFKRDFDAMAWADACILVMPCGRSAHLEAGWCVGVGKPVAILFPVGVAIEPELMIKMCNGIARDVPEAITIVRAALTEPQK